ncbi:hypothetical protein AWC29_23920 [Mycobacterium triplex]|uniref:Uncharacterized protein n=1 Tax=Mycobacterium triplex TaxID=47839 RepID=A0ABX3VYZ3_9MYCO|nr:hypothetical protein AWC29_23920 [Mycobacterium triplex]
MRPHRVHAGNRGAGDPQSHGPSLRQQSQVGSPQRRKQISGARSDADAVDDVERHRADARGQLGPAIIEIGDPGEPGSPRRGDETFSGSGHFVRAAHPYRAAVAVGGTGEIQVGLDGAEMLDNVRPRPARYRGPIEVARQPATEVAAIDRARTPDRCPPHDRQLASGLLGDSGRVALHQRATRPDRQLQPVGGLGQQRRIVQRAARFEDGHGAGGIGGKTFGNNRSSTSGADDQHIAVRGGQGGG